MEKKTQTTIYLTPEDKQLLNKMLALRLLKGDRSSMTEIISDALKEKYDREFE